MTREKAREVTPVPPTALPWKCGHCRGTFRLWDEASTTYECDLCGEAGALASWARRKLGLPT